MRKCALVILLLLPFVMRAQIISTYAGGGSSGLGDGGPATAGQIGIFQSLATDRQGNLYIADVNNNRIRKVDAATGTISTFAGNGTIGFSGDGGPATDAEFSFDLFGFVTTDKVGNVYISDGANYRVRKVDVSTGIISTIAGNGVNLHLGDGGPATAASFAAAEALAFDNIGNLYISDEGAYIRKIDTFCIISNYAGNDSGFYSGDGGPATAAQIYCGGGITCDVNNNLYISASTRIRKVNFLTGIISTIAGNGSTSSYTDSVPAISSSVQGWFSVLDPIGQIYLSELAGTENKVRRIDTSGIIYEFAGEGDEGFSCDGGPADSCLLNEPAALAFDPCGNIYIADQENSRVRKVSIPSRPVVYLSGNTSATIGSVVSVTADVYNAGTIYSIKWYNHGTLFATTSVPLITYTKAMAVDSITARVVSSSCGGADSSVSTVHIITNSRVGVPEIVVSENKIQIFPNPAHTQFQLQSSDEIQTISITNLLGQVVYNCNCSGNNATINIEKLQNGVYFVRMNGWWVGKLIKE